MKILNQNFLSCSNKLKIFHCIWCCTFMCNVVLMLTCFFLKNGYIMFFWSETIVPIFLHLMVLFYKVLINHTLKYQLVMILCCILLLIRDFQHYITLSLWVLQQWIPLHFFINWWNSKFSPFNIWQTAFVFRGIFYFQIGSLGMESPLSTLLCDIYMHQFLH